jgi:hypothetical protein
VGFRDGGSQPGVRATSLNNIAAATKVARFGRGEKCKPLRPHLARRGFFSFRRAASGGTIATINFSGILSGARGIEKSGSNILTLRNGTSVRNASKIGLIGRIFKIVA